MERRSVSSLLLLVICLALGVVVAQLVKPPASLSQSLNWWVINIALSALVLHLIPTLQFDRHLWFLAAAMWVVFVSSWAFFALIGRWLHWPRARIGALVLVGGLVNSLVGFPIIEALHGQEGLKLAIVADQAGASIAMAVGGSLAAAFYSGNRVQPKVIARKVLLFPPFIALFVGIAAATFGGWPASIEPVLQRIGSTLVPIALFSVGLQLRLSFGDGQLAAVSLGLAWKLAAAPLIVYGLGTALGVGGMILTIAVLQAAMAPMISAAILAAQNNLDASVANATLGIGILLSLVTVPLTDKLL
jgi:malate permease and related proteins